MKKPRNKFAYMLVGIFIGILIAFSIVLWQGNNMGRWTVIKKLRSYFSNVFTKHEDHDVTLITENMEKGKQSKAKQAVLNPELKNDSAYYDSTNKPYYDPIALDEFLAKYSGKLPDSLVLDSIIKSQNNIDINSYNTADNLQVKKDTRIYAKSYSVPGIDIFDADMPGKLDSILTDSKSGAQNKTKNTLFVEFWKSPINYKGYKTGVNKLVLFGIDQFDMVAFKLLNKILYMKYRSDFYQLDKTNDFRNLIPVNNPQLLSQLNSK